MTGLTCRHCGATVGKATGLCPYCGLRLEVRPVPREGRAYVEGRKGWLGLLNRVLDLAPGLARGRVLLAAGSAIAAATGVLLVLIWWHWHRRGLFGIIAIPLFFAWIGCAALISAWALSWILCGSVCYPADALAMIDRGRWRLLLVSSLVLTALEVTVAWLVASWQW